MKLIALGLAGLLTACGGGGSQSPTVTASCVALATVRIQLFGDSTQAGFDGETRTIAATTPQTALQAYMDARFGAGAVVVENRGALGATSAQLLVGTDGVNKPWPQSVDAPIAVVNSGINDARDAVPLSTYRTNLGGMAGAIFETPNPLHDRPFDSDAYAQVMRDMGPVIDTAAFVRSLPNWQAMIPDGIHPTAELYGMIGAQVLGPALAAKVAALMCQSR